MPQQDEDEDEIGLGTRPGGEGRGEVMVGRSAQDVVTLSTALQATNLGSAAGRF